MQTQVEYLTPEEVGAELRVTVETVYRWCRAGLGTRFGNQYRITREQLAEFAEQSRKREPM